MHHGLSKDGRLLAHPYLIYPPQAQHPQHCQMQARCLLWTVGVWRTDLVLSSPCPVVVLPGF